MHSGRRFSRRVGTKIRIIAGWETSRPLLPGSAQRALTGLLPGKPWRLHQGTDDSWPLRRRHGRGYRGTLTLPRGPELWPIPPAGVATASPTPARTAARVPRESWPAPSTPTSAAGARNFHQDHGHLQVDQDPRPAAHPVNSGSSGSPGLALQGVTIMKKMATCWTCGRTL